MITPAETKLEELKDRIVRDPAARKELVQLDEGIDGNPLCIPLISLYGAHAGPRIWIQAQTHGDEPISTEAILRFVRDLDVGELKGTILALPTINSTALQHFRRESPLDMKNGNRVWGLEWRNPGHTRVFSYIWMEKIGNLIGAFGPDLLIDMHDGGLPLKIVSHAIYDPRYDESAPWLRELCSQTAAKVVFIRPSGRFSGTAATYMYSRGIPSITLESGGGGRLQDSENDINELTRGLENVMRFLGVLSGNPMPREDEQLEMVDAAWVRAQCAGLVHPLVNLGEWIQTGQAIARITNIFGDLVDTPSAPWDGLVFGLRTLAVCNTGDYVANVARPADTS